MLSRGSLFQWRIGMEAISQDLRDRVLDVYDLEELSRKAVAERFQVSYSWLGKLLRQRRETGSTAAKPHTGNRPSPMAERVTLLTALIDQQPDATLSELRDRLNQKQQTALSRSTVSRAVQQADRPLKKSPFTPTSGIRRGCSACASNTTRPRY
jgi:transposase